MHLWSKFRGNDGLKCKCATVGVQEYLRATVNGLPAIHNDVAQSVVSVQLHGVKLTQLDGVGVTYGGHARTDVKPETERLTMHHQGPAALFKKQSCAN